MRVDELAIGWSEVRERLHFVPAHVVDAYLERALHACDRGRGNVGQRRLLEGRTSAVAACRRRVRAISLRVSP